MEKAHVAAGGPFCGVRRRPNFWAFLLSFVRRRLKNWISVGDRITGLFPCMHIILFLFSRLY